jgi:hypothetical protein
MLGYERETEAPRPGRYRLSRLAPDKPSPGPASVGGLRVTKPRSSTEYKVRCRTDKMAQPGEVSFPDLARLD